MTGLVVALDDADLVGCEALAKELAGKVSAFKVGLTLYAAHGPEAILEIGQHAPVFCDLKYHDIPSQVAAAARELARQGVWMFTVHASGGPAMIRAAVDAASDINPKSLVAGVTVLTSLSTEDLAGVGHEGTASELVHNLAAVAVGAGAQALVCSGEEASGLRAKFGDSVLLIVPGIRLEGTQARDQARIATPAAAKAAGADHVVVGRAITESPDPLAATEAILQELRR